jgi:sporulation protein YlmC with PRC-barrel domain
MKFKQNSTVKSATGETVGRVSHFVIDPRSNEITHLVVEKGFLFMEDRVVPVESVATADEDEIRLRPGRGEPEDFPLFETQYYIRSGEYSTEPDLYPSMSAYYYYPPVAGMGSWGAVPIVPPVSAPGMQSGMTQSAGPMNVSPINDAGTEAREAVDELPEHSVAVRKGADVYSSDGTLVGQVDEVFTSADSNRVTHILISQGLLVKNY